MNNIPKFPEMRDIEKRVESFRSWPENKPDVNDMAKSGLYYSGFDDTAVCFTCGGLLGNWENDDDPLFEHRKFFPDCKYTQFIVREKENHLLRVFKTSQMTAEEKIRALKTTFSLEKVKDSSGIVIDSSECKMNLRNSFSCKICMDREMCIVFQPCGHLIACKECVKQLCSCPLCRSVISSKITTFIS